MLGLVALFSVIGMALVQIVIFCSLPLWWKRFFAYWPLPALLINFICSGLIAAFTGIGAIAGMSNLFGSIIFGIYIVTYKHVWNIRGEVIWKGWWIFRYPSVKLSAKKKLNKFLQAIF